MNYVQALDTGAGSAASREPKAPLPWQIVGALVVGALLVIPLSVPAVLVPGTRTGATVAAALIAGALAANGRRWPSRTAVGVVTGVALGLAVSAAAWALLSDDAPDPLAWQAVALNIVTHSMIAPLDELLAPWLGGFEQMEEHLLLARFTASNLVLGLAGGLLGGLLSSGSTPGRCETQGVEEDAEEQLADGVEGSEDGPHDAPPPEGRDVEEQPPDGVEDVEESEDGPNDAPPPEGKDVEEQPREGVEEGRGVRKRLGRRVAFRRRIRRR